MTAAALLVAGPLALGGDGLYSPWLAALGVCLLALAVVKLRRKE